jgi:hypothetical protein
MTKALSLHGLGLYIYAGEDLPEEPAVDVSEEIFKIYSASTLEELKDFYTLAYKAAINDNEAKKMVINAKNLQKAKLEGLNGTAN